MKILVRKEKEEDYLTVESLIRKAFWDVYKPGCDEHLMVHQLHKSKDFIPELDFVAEYNGIVIGNVLCSKCTVINDTNNIKNDEDIIAIGPIGVLPEYQKCGVGRLLIEKVKEKAIEIGLAGIVLYGNPMYYHRFGFVNAKKYNLSTPDNTNFEEFMALELTNNSLKNIEGRCLESDAFEIDRNVLNEFDKMFVEENRLDYTTIKNEFAKSGKEFPLSEYDQVGLTLEEMKEINPCGTCCGTCEDYGVVCDGCRNRKGIPLWYHLYDKAEVCGYYQCCELTKKHDCSQCNKLPCNKFFDYPDPNMSDDFKQMWLKLRIDNLNTKRSNSKIELEDTFNKNVLKFINNIK